MKQEQRQQVFETIAGTPGYEQRKNRYVVVSKILEKYHGLIIEPKDCQLICSLADEFRHQTVKDSVGEKLEQAWHNTPVTREVQSWDLLFKRTNQLQ